MLGPSLSCRPPPAFAPQRLSPSWGRSAPFSRTVPTSSLEVITLRAVAPRPMFWLTVKSRAGRRLTPPETKRRTGPGVRSFRFSDQGLRVARSTVPVPRSRLALKGSGSPGRVSLTS